MNYLIITTIPEKRSALSEKIKISNIFTKEETKGQFMGENICVEVWKSKENVLLLPDCVSFDNTVCDDEQKRSHMASFIKSFVPNLTANDNLYIIIHSRDIHSDVTILEQEEIILEGDVFYSIGNAHKYLFRFHHDKHMGFQIFRKPVDDKYCAGLIKCFKNKPDKNEEPRN